MKKILAIVLPLAIITGFMGGCRSSNTVDEVDALGFVNIDINPSIQLITENNNVTGVTATNDDGEIVLIDILDNLLGAPIEQAIDKILDSSIELGYIDVDALENNPNIVTVTAILENVSVAMENDFRNTISNRAEQRLKNSGIFGVVLTDQHMEDISVDANALGLSIARHRLITSVQKLNSDLTLDDAINLTNTQLIEQLKNRGNSVDAIRNRVQGRVDLVEHFNDKIISIENEISILQDNLVLKQAELTALEDVDFIVDEYTQTQIDEHIVLVVNLNSIISDISFEINGLESKLSGLNNALHIYSDKLDELFVNSLDNIREQRRDQAEDKFQNWNSEKNERANDIASGWNSFRDDHIESNIGNILDRVQNRFND